MSDSGLIGKDSVNTENKDLDFLNLPSHDWNSLIEEDEAAKQRKCRECGDIFNSTGAMLKHHSLTHVAKTKQCHICKVFISKNNFKRHIQKHSSEN
jgi:hypothetical protein